MSLLTQQPVGLYPEDRDRIKRILAAKPELVNVSALMRFALKELDERLARRQKTEPVEPTEAADAAVPAPEVPPVPSQSTDDETRLRAVMKDRTPNAIDLLAKVPRGTTRNVLVRGRSLAKAAGGKLLKWVEKAEREA